MKCNACGASWDETTVNKTLLACPFCGELLEKKKPKKTRKQKKEQSMKDVLSQVIGLRGESVLEDRDMTIGLMSDLAPKLVKERRQLGMFYDIGAMKTVLGGCHRAKADQQRLCKKTTTQLIDELDMAPDAASELAVAVCSAVYGRKMSAGKEKGAEPEQSQPPKSESVSRETKGSQKTGSVSQASASGASRTSKSTGVKGSSAGTGSAKPKSTATQTSTKGSASSSGSAGTGASGAAANAGSGVSSKSSSPSGQPSSGSKPIISHSSTTVAAGGKKKGVLAGASMVKSDQDIQQAALMPKGSGGTASAPSGANASAHSAASQTQQKKSGSATTKKTTRRTRSTQPKQTSASPRSSVNTNTTYTQSTVSYGNNNGQSNWTPTPEQLQAYQYYTGKAYPQSAVPQSSGYQPWQPAGTGASSGQKTGYNQRQSRNRTTTQPPSMLQLAMNGDRDAMYQVGLQYLRGTGGMTKDVNEALKWITGAANKGDENAGFMLGYLNYAGTEIPKNETEALRWFLKTVKPSDHEIQCLIGMLYAYGTTISRNYTEAFKWFYKAGQGGSAQAQFALGEFYHYGYDMEVNDREAANWYGKAARQGHAKAKQMADALNRQGISPQTTTSTGPQLTTSQWAQVSNAVQQAVQQQWQNTGNNVHNTNGQRQPVQTTAEPQLPPQTQSWLNGTSRGAASANSWQQRLQSKSNEEGSGTRSPGWRQNQNIGVVSSNRPVAGQSSGYQTLPSESKYALGQHFSSKVNRSVLQEDDDDDWMNLSKRKGFADSQT